MNLQNHTSPTIYQLEYYSEVGHSISINKSGNLDCPGSDVLENFGFMQVKIILKISEMRM